MQITSDYYRDKSPLRRSAASLSASGSRSAFAVETGEALHPLRPSGHTLRQLAKIHRNWRSR